MEKWIIASTDEVSIQLTDYNLPHDFRKLKEITKTSKSDNDDIHSNDFKRLFKSLKDSQSTNSRVLAFWVEYLKSTNYEANLEYLKFETDKILRE